MFGFELIDFRIQRIAKWAVTNYNYLIWTEGLVINTLDCDLKMLRVTFLVDADQDGARGYFRSFLVRSFFNCFILPLFTFFRAEMIEFYECNKCRGGQPS